MTMHTQTPASATIGHVQAIERSTYLQRRDAALTELAVRTGADLPTIQDAGRPKPLPVFMLGEALVQALLAEAVVRLAGEVDALRVEVATLKGAPVSANGGDPR